MQHNFECDNCGKEVITYCFDPEISHHRYFTPPLKEPLEDGTLVPTDYAWNNIKTVRAMMDAIDSSVLLCIECVEQ